VAAIGVAELIQRHRRLRAERRFRPAEVILYTRSECHLCHEARAILERVSGELPIRWREIDVDGDPELAGRYGGQVPVIVAGGVKLSKLRPDETAIRRRLARMASDRESVARPVAFS
jgi:glutaredoxin